MKKLLKEEIKRLQKLAGINESTEFDLADINEFLIQRIEDVVNDYINADTDEYVSGGTPDRETYTKYWFLYIEDTKRCLDALKREFKSVTGEDKELLQRAMEHYKFKDINDLAERALAWAESYLEDYEPTEEEAIDGAHVYFDPTGDDDEDLNI